VQVCLFSSVFTKAPAAAAEEPLRSKAATSTSFYCATTKIIWVLDRHVALAGTEAVAGFAVHPRDPWGILQALTRCPDLEELPRTLLLNSGGFGEGVSRSGSAAGTRGATRTLNPAILGASLPPPPLQLRDHRLTFASPPSAASTSLLHRTSSSPFDADAMSAFRTPTTKTRPYSAFASSGLSFT